MWPDRTFAVCPLLTGGGLDRCRGTFVGGGKGTNPPPTPGVKLEGAAGILR